MGAYARYFQELKPKESVPGYVVECRHCLREVVRKLGRDYVEAIASSVLGDIQCRESQRDDMAKPGQKGYDACACSGCGMLACRCRFTNKAEVSQPMSPSNSYFECPGCIDCGGKVSYNECSACRNWCARCPACNHARWVFKECPACSDGLPADVRALLSNFSW